MTAPDEVLVRPDRLRAAGWSLVGIVSLWLAAWATVYGDIPRWLGVSVLVAGTLLTALVAVQVVAPGLWTFRVTTDRVHGRIAGYPFDTTYEGCRAVDVAWRFGEPRLVLRRDPKRILVLPIGADVAALETVVARIDLAAPTS